MKTVLIIPARYASSRLPGKPLLEIAGKSMVERTFIQCAKAFPANDIYVATDDKRIEEHCKLKGIKVLITSSDCLTGTDRIAEATKLVAADYYINVQGDEPLINPEDISLLVKISMKYPEYILNGFAEIQDEEMYFSYTIPKVVCRSDGRLLYMSRAPIPTTKLGKFKKAKRQICIYGFPRKALQAFASQNNKTALEEIEDIEILRFLELGFEVQMIEMSGASIAVDTIADLESVRKLVNDRDREI